MALANAVENAAENLTKLHTFILEKLVDFSESSGIDAFILLESLIDGLGDEGTEMHLSYLIAEKKEKDSI